MLGKNGKEENSILFWDSCLSVLKKIMYKKKVQGRKGIDVQIKSYSDTIFTEVQNNVYGTPII